MLLFYNTTVNKLKRSVPMYTLKHSQVGEKLVYIQYFFGN